MLTQAQNALYWREWSAAKRALMPSRVTWTKHEEETRRHELHIRALDVDKSHLDFDNDDFDKVLGALRAISRPNDLNAQLHQVRGTHRRARHALDVLMIGLGVGRNYVQGVVDKMNFEHRGSATLHPSVNDLTVDELKKVIIALRKQAKRKRAVHFSRHDRVDKNEQEPAEVPF